MVKLVTTRVINKIAEVKVSNIMTTTDVTVVSNIFFTFILLGNVKRVCSVKVEVLDTSTTNPSYSCF